MLVGGVAEECGSIPSNLPVSAWMDATNGGQSRAAGSEAEPKSGLDQPDAFERGRRGCGLLEEGWVMSIRERTDGISTAREQEDRRRC